MRKTCRLKLLCRLSVSIFRVWVRAVMSIFIKIFCIIWSLTNQFLNTVSLRTLNFSSYLKFIWILRTWFKFSVLNERILRLFGDLLFGVLVLNSKRSAGCFDGSYSLVATISSWKQMLPVVCTVLEYHILADLVLDRVFWWTSTLYHYNLILAFVLACCPGGCCDSCESRSVRIKSSMLFI